MIQRITQILTFYIVTMESSKLLIQRSYNALYLRCNPYSSSFHKYPFCGTALAEEVPMLHFVIILLAFFNWQWFSVSPSVMTLTVLKSTS